MGSNQKEIVMSITTFKRSSGSLVLAAFAAAALTTAVPASAELSFSDISADTAFARDRPQVARDADGNYHVVYRKGDAGTRARSATAGNIGYMMVAPNGNVLIDEVNLTVDRTANVDSVDVEVGSDGKVFVAFGHRNDRDLRMLVIDPSLAPQDGTAPALGTITDVAEVTVAGTFNHPFIELDDTDNVYVWSQNGFFAKYDNSLAEVVAPAQPFTGPDENGHGTSPIALDSDGNVHVVFQDCDVNLCTVSYGMLDGADGSVLIDQTNVITEVSTAAGANVDVGDAPHAVHYNIMVDSKDKVNLVWVDKRNTPIWDDYCEVCASGGTLYFAKLDPSLDDQDGSAADMTVIKTVDDVALGPYKYVQAYMGKNDTVNLFFGQRGGMSHIRVSGNGKATPAVLLATSAVSFVGWNKAYPAAMASDGRLFWPMVENADDGAGSKIVMGKVSLGGGGGGGSTAPALLLLVMGAAALRRRTAH